MHEHFSEHFHSQGVAVRVQREAGVIRGVKLLGLQSKNGRVYRPEALAAAAPLYEGARVNVNHAPGAGQVARSYEDRIGTIRKVAARPDGLYGDFHFNPKHRLAEQLVWDAEYAPENVGFSHNVIGRTAQQSGVTVVLAITKVHSVDLVADPATTSGLFENAARQTVSFFTPKERPMNSESDRNAPQTSEELLESLQQEIKTLREQLEESHARAAEAAKRAATDERLQGAGIPAELLTTTFREQCHAAADEQALEHLVTARLEDARLLKLTSRPRSAEQHREPPPATRPIDAAAFAASIR